MVVYGTFDAINSKEETGFDDDDVFTDEGCTECVCCYGQLCTAPYTTFSIPIASVSCITNRQQLKLFDDDDENVLAMSVLVEGNDQLAWIQLGNYCCRHNDRWILDDCYRWCGAFVVRESTT